MRKLLSGIVDFRKNLRDSYNEKFSRLAAGQTPDSLFIACSDSRVVPNLFASTNPGDLFVVRNVGNMIPSCCNETHSTQGNCESEAAAIEFSIGNLNVSDLIVCGHSECGAMQALLAGREELSSLPLKNWLKHGELALQDLKQGLSLDKSLSEHNQLSQLNVLRQCESLKSYPVVKEKISQKKLRVHAWWFDIKNADVYSFHEEKRCFELIDEKNLPQLIQKLD